MTQTWPVITYGDSSRTPLIVFTRCTQTRSSTAAPSTATRTNLRRRDPQKGRRTQQPAAAVAPWWVWRTWSHHTSRHRPTRCTCSAHDTSTLSRWLLTATVNTTTGRSSLLATQARLVCARAHAQQQTTYKNKGEGRVMWDNDSRNAPSPLLSTPSWTHSPGSVFVIKGNKKKYLCTHGCCFCLGTELKILFSSGRRTFIWTNITKFRWERDSLMLVITV